MDSCNLRVLGSLLRVSRIHHEHGVEFVICSCLYQSLHVEPCRISLMFILKLTIVRGLGETVIGSSVPMVE